MANEDRRNALKIIGAGIAGLVVGLAGGYAIGSSRVQAKPTATETVTVTAPATEQAGKPAPGIPSKPLKIGATWFSREYSEKPLGP